MEVVKEEAEKPAVSSNKPFPSIPMELLWAALCMAVLAALAVTLLSDGKPRFKFNLEPELKATPAPAPAPAPAATFKAAATQTAAAAVNVEAPVGIQSLFVTEREQRAERPPAASLFAPQIDYAEPRQYQNLNEADLGRIYAAAAKADKRALSKVARLGGFRSADAMAVAFGYMSVSQMLDVWDQRIQMGPQFAPEEFGTNATAPVQLPPLTDGY